MNYYERWVGDFQRDTGHLSCTEIGVYDRLLDHYYATETLLPMEYEALNRIARAMNKTERDAVKVVADRFFPLSDGGRCNPRADREITKAQHRITAAKENGKKGGRKPKQKPNKTQEEPIGFPVGSPQETQSGVHHMPHASTKPSETIVSGGKPPAMTPDEIIFGYGVPLLTNAGTAEKQARSFLGGLRKAHGEDALIDKLRECLKVKPLQPLEWLAAALPPAGSGPRKPAPENFNAINYGQGGRL